MNLAALPPAPGEEAIAAMLAEAIAGNTAALEKALRAAGIEEPAQGAAIVLDLAEDPLSRDRMPAVLRALVQALPGSAAPLMALTNFSRYCRVSLDRVSFYALLQANPALVHFLIQLFAFSQFLADILIRNPETLDWLLDPARLDADMNRAYYDEGLRAAVGPFRRIETIRRAMCRWKRRELLRIGVRDMLARADILQCSRELSWLAEAAIRLALDTATAELRARHGEPRAGDDADVSTDVSAAPPVGFVIYGMGKLGGEDLNFSSDIDLIFFYGAEGHTTGQADATGYVSNRIRNHEYFSRLGERVAAFLNEPSDEGMLFRVDLRLRPEGKAGPLVRSLSSLSNYLAEQANPWERAVYAKGRCVAGDATLAKSFDQLLQSYVYAPGNPEELFTELSRLKNRIDNELLDPGERARDVKRGTGGIREIEFIAISQQLVAGNRHADLRTRNTVEALRRLADHGMIPTAEVHALIAAYRFLRRVEHRLQMMEERQTYLIPEEPAEWAALARRMGIVGPLETDRGAAATRLHRELAEHTSTVHAIFHRIFRGSEATPAVEEQPIDLILAEKAELHGSRAQRLLESLGFREPLESLRRLRELASGSADTAISSTSQRWFAKVLPILLDEARHIALPDAAVGNLVNFLRACKGLALMYALLAEAPPLLRLLLKVFGSSPAASRALIAHPEWFDEIANLGLQATSLNLAAEEKAIATRIARIADDDAAARHLRIWKERVLLLITLFEAAGLYSRREAARATSTVADIVVRVVANRADSALRIAAGAEPVAPPNWAIFGFGGYGGGEATQFSDLDLLIVFDPPADSSRLAQDHAVRVGEIVIATLSALTPEGQLFKVDARLRPDGRSAPLASTVERTVAYYANEAQTWEWQALCRARAVAGNPELADRFLDECWAGLPGRFSDTVALAAEVQQMRVRLRDSVRLPNWAEADLKRGDGGIVDLEFILQFLTLGAAARRPGWRRREVVHPDFNDACGALVRAGEITDADCVALERHHESLRALQRVVRSLFETSRDYVPSRDERLESLRRAAAPALPPHVELLEHLRETREACSALYQRLVRP